MHNPVTPVGLVSGAYHNPVTVVDGVSRNALYYESIQAAIDVGEGDVVIPYTGSSWLISATIVVKTGVNVHAEKGVVVESSDDINMVECLVNGTWDGGRIYNSNANFSKTCAFLEATNDKVFGRAGHDTGFRNVQLVGPAEGKGSALYLKAFDAAVQFTLCSNVSIYKFHTGILLDCHEGELSPGVTETAFITSNTMTDFYMDDIIYALRVIESSSGVGIPALAGNIFNNFSIQSGTNMVRSILGSAHYYRNWHMNWHVWDWWVVDHTITGSITFDAGTKTIDVAAGATKFVVGQPLTISDTTDNNKAVTVATIVDDTEFTVNETLVNETDASATITPDEEISVEFTATTDMTGYGNILEMLDVNYNAIELGVNKLDVVHSQKCPNRFSKVAADFMPDPVVWGNGAFCYVKDNNVYALVTSNGENWQYLNGQAPTVNNSVDTVLGGTDIGPGIVYGTSAAGAIQYTLPTANIGNEIIFSRGSSGQINLRVTNFGLERFIDTGGYCTTANDDHIDNNYLHMDATFSYVHLRCYSQYTWQVLTGRGTLQIDNLAT